MFHASKDLLPCDWLISCLCNEPNECRTSWCGQSEIFAAEKATIACGLYDEANPGLLSRKWLSLLQCDVISGTHWILMTILINLPLPIKKNLYLYNNNSRSVFKKFRVIKGTGWMFRSVDKSCHLAAFSAIINRLSWADETNSAEKLHILIAQTIQTFINQTAAFSTIFKMCVYIHKSINQKWSYFPAAGCWRQRGICSSER